MYFFINVFYFTTFADPQIPVLLLHSIVTYMWYVYTSFLQPGRGRLDLLHLYHCTLAADQLVDLVCLVSPPGGLPRLEMRSCSLIHDGESPPRGQPVLVENFIIQYVKELNMAALEVVSHSVSMHTLSIEVSNIHSEL